jgi:hypothetical protein
VRAAEENGVTGLLLSWWTNSLPVFKFSVELILHISRFQFGIHPLDDGVTRDTRAFWHWFDLGNILRPSLDCGRI